ncbi:MAG: aminotransferase class I/II-fold pyridoxal phosphate-dependent enzyme [Phycisphaerales bacterium]
MRPRLGDPIDLFIGQPDFDVPDQIKQAAIEAIRSGFNKYTQTQGIKPLADQVRASLACTPVPQARQRLRPAGDVRRGEASGATDDVLRAARRRGADPRPVLRDVQAPGEAQRGKPVFVDTYPDFQLKPERIEPLINERTKMLLFNSPSNPTGVVATAEACKQIAELADRHNLLLVSDEIYDEFSYEKIDDPNHPGEKVVPSPLDHNPNVLLLNGYSKTYAMTGWRLGYAAGPSAVIGAMTKLQQYSFVCAPSVTQAAGAIAFNVDMAKHVDAYRCKRDMVVERLSPYYELTTPGGAFYAFPKVPDHLGLNATDFVKRAIENSLLVIPGNVFSERDTHFRISYACDNARLERGLDVLVKLAKK